MIFESEDYLKHYGTPRHSGRYPWGSGKNGANTRNATFLDYVAGMKAEGYSEADIIKDMGMTTTEFRQRRSLENAAKKQADIAMAQRLKDKGWSNTAIGERMGRNESSIRAMLKAGEADKALVLDATSDMLKDELKTKRFLDVGVGAEHHLNGGISKGKLATAVKKLEDEGYAVHRVQVDQLGTDKKTTIKVLAPPGTTYVDVVKNLDGVEMIAKYTEDGGRSWAGIEPPVSVDPSRVRVNWATEEADGSLGGGALDDGVIYLRPGVKKLQLDGARYAQVRIKVGEDHYLKGMAYYRDDLPPGADIVFNTNKLRSGNKLDAMKKLKDDPENPFGSVVRQLKDEQGNVVSALNIVYEEGSWDEWSRNLASQMLSKQSPELARTQLAEAKARKQAELDDILALTNPTVRAKLLQTYADSADSEAVHLQAANMPGQRTQVILPMNSLKDTEIYAPNFKNGDQVVLVRYPHGGIFEIPQLTVNNRHPEAKKVFGSNPKDAVAINSRVAEQLSGADFDGDTVLVIPNNHQKVKTAPPLEGLKTFDGKREYAPYDGMRTIDGGYYDAKTGTVDYGDKKPSPRTMQREMGDVSNLITDMTIKGAPMDEIELAVKHSMVVIDSEKHHLDYKRSKQQHRIASLKEKYQGGPRAGASTLISRSTSEDRTVLDRRLRRASDGGPIDPKTGEVVYTYTNEGYERTRTNKRTGETTTEWVPKRLQGGSTKGAETKDAHTLSSGTVIEKIYADHSNDMKGLANRARLELLKTPPLKKSPSARRAYAPEFEELRAALRKAESNAPLERRAQVLGGTIYKQKVDANPDMDKSEKKKIRYLALEEARRRTGAGKQRIKITPRQWEAIQSGAISNHMLERILNNADLDLIKEFATPRASGSLTPGLEARALAMLAAGRTQAEVADALGVSTSTINSLT